MDLALFSDIAQREKVTLEDVASLRRQIYGGRGISKAQVEALFAINHAPSRKSPEWCELFIEASAVFLVEQQKPRCYVDEAGADWLMEHLTRDGRIDTATELEVLVTVLEKAKSSPARLVQFALTAVKETVLDGAGPARRGGHYSPGVVTEEDVALLRRILYAYGGDQHVGVSRAEAQVLFAINDATFQAQNHASWSDLFVKAVASCVLAYSGYEVPSRQKALARAEWLDQPVPFGSLLSSMAASLGQVFSGNLSPLTETPDDPAAMAAGVAEARLVTDSEAAWLSEHIGKDRKLHVNERALVAFLSEKSTEPQPILQGLLDR